MKIIFIILLVNYLHANLPVEFSYANINGINYVPSARNQHFPEVCNSDWAIAATDVLSTRIKFQRKGQFADIQISPQVLLECDSLNFGCYGGDPRNAFRWISENNITDQTCNTYTANSSRQCSAVSKCMSCSSQGCKAQSGSRIYGVKDFGNIAGTEQMMNHIYFNGSIACGMAITPQFKNYTKGILTGTVKSQKIEHFVMIYGWGQENGVKYWNALNTWGTFWGQSGTFRILRGQNTLGIESQCSFATPLDTWTDDVRNNTPAITTENKAKPYYLTNLTFITPLRTSKSPVGCTMSWALAVVSTMSDKISIASNGQKNIVLSPQVLVNCKVGTCSGGDVHDALQFANKFGIPEQSCQNQYGIDTSKNSCTDLQNCATCTGYVGQSTCSAVKTPKRWRLTSFGTLSGSSKMKEQIDTHGPIICGIQVTSSFSQYTNGIYKQITILPQINHYVEIVAHGTQKGQDYWIVRNSWGSAWGQQGFFRIAMHSNNLGIQTSCYYLSTPQ